MVDTQHTDSVDQPKPPTALVTPEGLQLNVLHEEKSQADFAREITLENGQEAQDGSLLVMDVGEVIRQHARWQQVLPTVEPFYAVKCNDDVMLLRTLAALGCGFDCASKGEITKVLDLGVSASRIIYANPCKTRSFIADAHKRGVNVMTFDNVDELKKIKRVHPNAELVSCFRLSSIFHIGHFPGLILRIAVSDPTAQCELNIKFGCEPTAEADALLAAAAQLGITVVGISFHIGSGAACADAWAQGIEHARRLFDVGRLCGHNMRILDIGGGFRGVRDDPGVLLFEHVGRITCAIGKFLEMFSGILQAAATINSALREHFSDVCGVRVVAEPGRYFASTAFSLSCAVIARAAVDASRITGDGGDAGAPGFMYYINDGVYGSFNCILYDHQLVCTRRLHENASEKAEMTYAAVWGPTCDGLDCVLPKVRLPRLQEGEWLIFGNMGAYTTAAASTFNGFPTPDVHYFISARELLVIPVPPGRCIIALCFMIFSWSYIELVGRGVAEQDLYILSSVLSDLEEASDYNTSSVSGSSVLASLRLSCADHDIKLASDELVSECSRLM